MTCVISLALKLLLVYVVTASIPFSRSEGVYPRIDSRHGNHRSRSSSSNSSISRVASFLRAGPSGVHSPYQRDEGSRGQAQDQPVMVEELEEEEERYVPASFNIDDLGNGFFNGHAIEMMPPVEVPEYGWNEESRGLSELEHGATNGGQQQQNPQGSDTVTNSSGNLGDGLSMCGGKQIDPTHALCCNGLVYRKSPQDEGRCCGSVAYDDRFFTCCQGRAIVRKTTRLPLCCGDYTRDSLPDQCRFGYERDSTGLGSTCCRSASGSWNCCLKGDSCCTGSGADRGTAIEVPGFRPACCHLANENLTAQCCATTYQKIRVLPDCCGSDRLKPVCCRRRVPETQIRCCPGTIGYCCGRDEQQVPPTPRPHEIPIYSTRAPLVPYFTYPPRQTYVPRITYIPRPVTYAPRPSYAPRLTHPPLPSYTTRYPYPLERHTLTPGDRLLQTTAALPYCCSKKTPLRQCCSGTKSPTCCRSVRFLPRCCFVIYYNPVCCQTQLQQQQQQQQQQRVGREVGDSSHNSTIVDVPSHEAALADAIRHRNSRERLNHPVGNAQATSLGAQGVLRLRSELSPDTINDGERSPSRPPQAIGGSNSRSSDGSETDSGVQAERQTVALSCCRLDTLAAISCCRDGYEETGRLPACCISSPVELLEPNDADPTVLLQNPSSAPQELSLDATEAHKASHRPRRMGQRSHSRDGLPKAGSSKAIGRNPKNNTLVGRPCNGTSFDEEEYICCNNTQRKRIGVSPSCCSSVAYDKLLYKCCDGKVRVSCRHDYKPKKSVWGVHV